MSQVKLPVITSSAPVLARLNVGSRRDAAWVRTARQARALSWASLAWMTVEGAVGLIAGLDAGALSVVVWAASSFVEGLASMIVVWRFTGARTLSQASERTAQRLVAGGPGGRGFEYPPEKAALSAVGPNIETQATPMTGGAFNEEDRAVVGDGRDRRRPGRWRCLGCHRQDLYGSSERQR